MSDIRASWTREFRWSGKFNSISGLQSNAEDNKRTLWIIGFLAALCASIALSGCGGTVPNASAANEASTGAIAASPSAVDFGTVSDGSSVSSQVVVTNQGSAAVRISQLTVSDSTFSVDQPGNLPLSLAAGSTLNLKLHFQPDSNADSTGQLSITTNSASTPTATVKLHGKGTNGPSTTQPTLSSLSCSTGSITGPGTDACTVALTAAAPGGGINISLSSSNSAITVPATVSVPANSINAEFTATVASVSSAQTATLTATAGGTSQSFSLQLNPPPAAATATLSALSCSSSSFSAAGSDSCTVTLTAASPNGGMTVSLSSNDAAVTVPASVSVPPNASSAGFAATVSSFTSSQTATLTASVGGTSKSFALQLAAGTSTLGINATNVSFGNVVLNTPATQSVTLTSTGTAAVNVSSAKVSGTSFSVSGATFPVTLNPGQSVTLNVQFDPTSTGTATGQLTIVSNSSGNSNAVINLSGTGEPHEVALSWNAPGSSSDPVAGYNVYRAQSGSSSYQLVNSSKDTQTTYTDTSVQSGQTYSYVVKSVDSSGDESAPSNSINLTIP